MSTLMRRFSPVVLLVTIIVALAQPASATTLLPASYSGGAALATNLVPPASYKVGLQVGHYKNNELPPQLSELIGNTGAVGGGRREVDLNMEMTNRVAALLRAQGVTVDILPATVPTGYSADAFIALHADGNGSPSIRGFKISTRWRSEVAAQDGKLMDLLTEFYRSATGLPEDGNVTRNMRGYYAYAPWRPNFRTSNFTPGAIVEMGFITSPADRAVMFGAADKVAAGITNGIMRYLRAAYPRAGTARTFGQGILDDDLDPDAPHPQMGGGGSNSGPRSRITEGDWQLYPIGSNATVNVYAEAGGRGGVIAQLPKGRFYPSTLRNGDYYRVNLPGGRQGWIHRNAIVVQT